jgi:hypothetical protein
VTTAVDVDDILARLESFVVARSPDPASDRALVHAARALSVAYTEHRLIELDAAGSLAYLAHFGPRAVVAVARALGALPRSGPSSPGGAHVVDLGAGSGASALPWLAAGARRVTLFDRSARSLAVAGEMLRACYPGADVQTVCSDALEAPGTRGASHVAAAFSLGEWHDVDVAPDRVRAVFARAAPDAQTSVIVDAGDHPRARRVQSLRDAWVASGDVAVLGPCPHRDPCPALRRERDWCHDVIAKRLPSRLAAFARAVGRDDETMAAAWLVCARGAAPQGPESIVVLGEAQRDKGRVRLPVCGPAGLRFVQVLKRHRKAFEVVAGISRGTRLVVLPHDGDTAHVDDEEVLVHVPTTASE